MLNFGLAAMKEGASAFAMASRSALLGMLMRMASAMALKCLRVMCVLQVKCALMACRQADPAPLPPGHTETHTHPSLGGAHITSGKNQTLKLMCKAWLYIAVSGYLAYGSMVVGSSPCFRCIL